MIWIIIFDFKKFKKTLKLKSKNFIGLLSTCKQQEKHIFPYHKFTCLIAYHIKLNRTIMPVDIVTAPKTPNQITLWISTQKIKKHISKSPRDKTLITGTLYSKSDSTVSKTISTIATSSFGFPGLILTFTKQGLRGSSWTKTFYWFFGFYLLLIL